MNTFKSINYIFFCLLFLLFLNNCKSNDDADPIEICNNGIDDDGDGFIDGDDSDCEEIFNNGIDDDGDGFTDCEDVDCDENPDC